MIIYFSAALQIFTLFLSSFQPKTQQRVIHHGVHELRRVKPDTLYSIRGSGVVTELFSTEIS